MKFKKGDYVIVIVPIRHRKEDWLYRTGKILRIEKVDNAVDFPIEIQWDQYTVFSVNPSEIKHLSRVAKLLYVKTRSTSKP